VVEGVSFHLHSQTLVILGKQGLCF